MLDRSLLVAAIDFGNTYSGCAFSPKCEFERDPTKISIKQWGWDEGCSHHSLKAPTCILIEPDGRTLKRFGYEAENKYAALAEEDAHKELYFFRNFNTELFSSQSGGKNVMIEDETGKKLPAMTVVTLCIKFFKDYCSECLSSRFGDSFADDDLYWVIIVPALCAESSKQFMREAALKAGIQTNSLTIALEPEAAIEYFRHLPKEECSAEKRAVTSFGLGKQFLVLDAAGDCVKTTLCEEIGGGQLKALHMSREESWGGNKVDKALVDFMSDMLGSSVMSVFISTYLEDYLDFTREFELKKRNFRPESVSMTVLRLPGTLEHCVRQVHRQTIQEVIQKSSYSTKVKYTGDKMRVSSNVFGSFFEPVVNGLVSHVKHLLKKSFAKRLEAILVVGGFSDSPMLKEGLLKAFPNLRVMFHYDAEVAILKGAVIFGHSCKESFLDVQDLPSDDSEEDELDELRKELEDLKVEEKKVEKQVKRKIEKENIKREIDERRRKIERLKAQHLNPKSPHLPELETGSDFLDENKMSQPDPDEVPGRKYAHKK